VKIEAGQLFEQNWVASHYTSGDRLSFSGLKIKHDKTTEHVTRSSTIASQMGNVEVETGGTFRNIASDVSAGDSIKIKAQEVDIRDGTHQSTDQHTSSELKFRPPVTASLEFQDTKLTHTTQRSSNFAAGNNLDIESHGNLVVTGSNLAAGNQANLTGQNVVVQNGLYTDTNKSVGGSTFAGLGLGYVVVGASANASNGSYQTLTPSTVTAGSQININGSQSVGIKATKVQAGDSINVSTPNLAVNGEYQKSDSKNYGGSAFIMIGPNGPIGGGAGVNGGYEKSGKYFASEFDANHINLNSLNQTIDGARINGQDINPHSDYHEVHQFSLGVGYGAGTPSINLGFDNFSIAAGTGKTSFASVGFKQFNLGTALDPSNKTANLFAGGYGFNTNLNISNTISSDHTIWTPSISYGPLGIGASFQHGDLKTMTGVAGFANFSKTIEDWDWQCFEEDAPIETNKGLKLIPEVKAGDVVKTWNENTKQFEWKKVLNVFEKTVDRTLHVQLSNGQTMNVTPEHKILVAGSWILAKDLKVGNKLLGSNGKVVFVQSIQIVNKKVKVYNFETEDNHTYLAYGVVVHNKCWVNTKDGKTSLIDNEQYAQLIKDGKEPKFAKTENGIANPNNSNNPINQAFEAAKNGIVIDDFKYTPEQFIEFIQSEDGFEAAKNYQGMNKIISDHYKWMIVGSGAGIVLSELVGAFKNVIGISGLETESLMQQTFKQLGNLENVGILKADNILKENGFAYIGRTPGGYYKYYNDNGAKVQIRPNGQVYRYSGKGQNIIRYDSFGKHTPNHGQEFLF
jgi:hypothetical protein